MSKSPCTFSFESSTLQVSLTLRKRPPGYTPSLTLTAELKYTWSHPQTELLVHMPSGHSRNGVRTLEKLGPVDLVSSCRHYQLRPPRGLLLAIAIGVDGSVVIDGACF